MPEREDGKRDYPLDKMQEAPACAGAFCIGTELGFVRNLAQQRRKRDSDPHSEPHYFIKTNASLSPRTNYPLISPF